MDVKAMTKIINEYCRDFEDCVGCGIRALCAPIRGEFSKHEDICQKACAIISNDNNPYWERINAIAERQRAKGINKYGVVLESNPAAIMERINHLQEELIDGLMYCEWIKDKLMELERGKE